MKYFGTDGFRGEANETLNAHQAFLVGLSFGQQCKEEYQDGFIYIGKDTRISSSMLEHALAAGLSSSGMDVKLLGVVPTPVVSYLTRSSEAVGAVMISASHNPYRDNGIKLFNHHGQKIASSTEQKIEQVIDQEVEVKLVDGDDIGSIESDFAAIQRYIDFLNQEVPLDLTGLKVVLDCANGASISTAQKVFEKTGCELIVLFDTPDGKNINVNCGSTHVDRLKEKVLELKADVGFAFDGDADRCIGVNHLGQEVDGDHMIYIYARYLKEKNDLNNNLVVTTVMANLGLFKALDELGIETHKTAVGDKYVFEALKDYDGVIGGEQSGHIIFKKLANTGDGVLTALMMCHVMSEKNQSLARLSEDLTIYPQRLKNVEVVDKGSALENEQLKHKIESVNQLLGDKGRLLVRPSGTEPLVRVMVEAQSQELCDQLVDEIIDVIHANNL